MLGRSHLSFLSNNNSREPKGYSSVGSSKKPTSAFSSDVRGPPQSVHDNVVDHTLGHTSGGSRKPDPGNPLHFQVTPTNIHTTQSGKNLFKIGHVLAVIGVGPDCRNGVRRLSYKCPHVAYSSNHWVKEAGT